MKIQSDIMILRIMILRFLIRLLAVKVCQLGEGRRSRGRLNWQDRGGETSWKSWKYNKTLQDIDISEKEST